MALRDSLVQFADPQKALKSYHNARKPIADQIVAHGRRLGAFLG